MTNVVCFHLVHCNKIQQLRKSSTLGIQEFENILVLGYVTAFKFDGFSLDLLKGSFYRQIFDARLKMDYFCGAGKKYSLHQSLIESMFGLRFCVLVPMPGPCVLCPPALWKCPAGKSKWRSQKIIPYFHI